MQNTIYDFNDYKAFLREKIASRPNRGRGERAALADVIRCQRPFISQVLSGDLEFSLEQAELIAQHYSLDADETHFLILLLQRNRAGTSSLQTYFAKQIEAIRADRRKLKNRLKEHDQIPEQDRERYYSSWIYQAVHMIVDLEGRRTRTSIAEHLRTPENEISPVLQFLCDVGLIKQNGDQYSGGDSRIYLEKDSLHINKYHYNWRVRAMTSLDCKRPTDFHFSSALTISQSDAEVLRKMLQDFVEATSKRVANTTPEKVFSLCLDLFEI